MYTCANLLFISSKHIHAHHFYIATTQQQIIHVTKKKMKFDRLNLIPSTYLQ